MIHTLLGYTYGSMGTSFRVRMLLRECMKLYRYLYKHKEYVYVLACSWVGVARLAEAHGGDRPCRPMTLR